MRDCVLVIWSNSNPRGPKLLHNCLTDSFKVKCGLVSLFWKQTSTSKIYVFILESESLRERTKINIRMEEREKRAWPAGGSLSFSKCSVCGSCVCVCGSSLKSPLTGSLHWLCMSCCSCRWWPGTHVLRGNKGQENHHHQRSHFAALSFLNSHLPLPASLPSIQNKLIKCPVSYGNHPAFIPPPFMSLTWGTCIMTHVLGL